jgi:hypothetical protein
LERILVEKCLSTFCRMRSSAGDDDGAAAPRLLQRRPFGARENWIRLGALSRSALEKA